MNNSKETNEVILREYVDTAETFYNLVNVSIQQYDGVPGISLGLLTIDIQKHYIENPKKNDDFRNMMLERFEDLETSLNNVYSIIEDKQRLQETKETEYTIKKISRLINNVSLVKKSYFENNTTKKRTKNNSIDIVDEIIRLDKEVDKLQNIYSGLNTYINN